LGIVVIGRNGRGKVVITPTAVVVSASRVAIAMRLETPDHAIPRAADRSNGRARWSTPVRTPARGGIRNQVGVVAGRQRFDGFSR
jgi:hypothetical protein